MSSNAQLELLEVVQRDQKEYEMGQSLKGLLESQIGCDIVFKVGDETFKAPKLILAARSPAFRAQFFGLIGDRTVSKI